MCIRQILSLSKVILITLARLSSIHSADGAIMKHLSRDTFPFLAWRFHHQNGHFSAVISYFPFPPHFIYPVILTQGSLQYTLGHFLSDTENLNLGLDKSYCFVHCLEKMTNRKSCVTTFACFDSIFLKTLGSVFFFSFFFFFNNILIIPFVFRKYTSQYNPTVYFWFVHDSLQ